ncbi:MAG: (2Fe-2S) ferredoxin domain-containing protein, partial [Atopobiaceae bacterium]|nr:(2Fe-2S) ferredoxin domain-containing protein [Atopobiaceae bacterium]
MIRSQVLICGGTGCTSSGSQQIQDKFEAEIEKNDLEDEIKLVRTGCFGLCELGPVVIVYPDGTFYSRVAVDDVEEIVSEHLLKGRRVERLVYDDHGKAEADEFGNIALSDTTF